MQSQKQNSIAMYIHCRTYMQVIDIRHPIHCPIIKFRCVACDLSSRITSMFPFHGLKLRFDVMVENPSLITIREWKSSGSALYLVNREVIIMARAFFMLAGVNILSTHLTHTLDIDKWSRKTVWTVSIVKPVSCTILSMPITRFSSTTWWTFWTFYSAHL